MRILPRSLFIFVLVCAAALPATARKKSAAHAPPPPPQRNAADIEAATKLQVFLDRANFAPGKIDGHYGEFTLKALGLYRASRGEPVPPPPAKPDTAPDLTGIDVASVGATFVPYTVSEGDAQNVGSLPSPVPEQAKLKALPYRGLAEAIAEKFHCDAKFLDEVNGGKTRTLKVGDQLQVPNVEPFELSVVKDLKPGSEITLPVANDIPDDAKSPDDAPDASPATVSVRVDMKTNMLGVFDNGKLVAAYPVTIGSAQTVSPAGDWKIRGVAKLPKYRYDVQMLKHGERSGNFHMLPPGPNSPVGIVWIALNKKGIGLHGTNEPDTIGRAASHGCVRLANWDIVRLAGKVKGGVAVAIH